MYRPRDSSRGGSPIYDNDIVTAGEGHAPFCGRQQSRLCVCLGLEGPKGVFTNTRARSRSSSRAPEERNGSDFSKTKTKKAENTKQSRKPSSASGAKPDDGEPMKRKHSKKPALVPVPTFCYYPYTIDKIPSTTCDKQL